MAKTTKKSTTNAKKKGFLGKSFSLKSRKVQFFVTIFVIAIVGGGYLTLKSFAATGYLIYNATPDKIGVDKDPAPCGGSRGTDSSTGKNSVAVVGMLCAAYANSGSNTFQHVNMIVDSYNNPSMNLLNKNIRACTYVKATTQNTNFNINLATTNTSNPKLLYSNHTVAIPTDRYVTVCTDWVKSPVNNNLVTDVYLYSKPNQPVGLYIQSIRLESDQPITSTASAK